MGKTIDLFLSHNNADKPWTERLASAVEADRGGPPLKVFFDKWDVLPGGDVPIELEEGLQNSRYVGLVLSPESLSSDWVTNVRLRFIGILVRENVALFPSYAERAMSLTCWLD
jgi:TIR domain